MCASGAVSAAESFWWRESFCTSGASCYSSLLLQRSCWLLHPLLEEPIKGSNRSHKLLLSCESRIWHSSLDKANLSYNGKVAVLGKRVRERGDVSDLVSCPPPRTGLWTASKCFPPFCWKAAEQRGKFPGKVSSHWTVVGAYDAFWCWLYHLEERLPYTFIIVTMSFLNLKRKITVLFSWVIRSEDWFILTQKYVL